MIYIFFKYLGTCTVLLLVMDEMLREEEAFYFTTLFRSDAKESPIHEFDAGGTSTSKNTNEIGTTSVWTCYTV
jgi:hypothetical protein